VVESETSPACTASIPVDREPHLALESKVLGKDADEIRATLGKLDVICPDAGAR